MAVDVRKDKLGGRDRCREGISGVVVELKTSFCGWWLSPEPSALWDRLLDRKRMGCQITGCGRTGNWGHGRRVDQRLLLVCHCNAVWLKSSVSAESALIKFLWRWKGNLCVHTVQIYITSLHGRHLFHFFEDLKVKFVDMMYKSSKKKKFEAEPVTVKVLVLYSCSTEIN